ncbi:MAG TPA: hypothetical protein VFP43_08450 [Mesorhizobium sp.]|nr:hypothetical protein [Mesorhizobium sp.]
MNRIAPKPRRKGLLVWVLVSAGVLLVAGANAHLVYVAFDSQPECMDHAKTVGDGQRYRAAGSAC